GPTGSATPCVSGGASAGTKTLSGGKATSDAFTPTAAGTYCFRVEYTPDANAQYSPSVSSVTTNECFVAKEKPTTSTAIHLGATDSGSPVSAGSSQPINTVVHDSATVSGNSGTPTGSVTFNVWLGRITCPDPAQVAPDDTVTKTLVNGAFDP